MTVYLVYCPESGKGYVGKTVRPLELRWSEHCQRAIGGSSFPLHRAILKYGAQAFECIVLAETENLPELNAIEVEQIKTHKTKVPNGYNLTDGGDGSAGYIRSRETRARMSAARNGKKNSPEAIAKQADKVRGRKHTSEELEKMRTSHTGVPRKPFTLQHRASLTTAAKKRKKRIVTSEMRTNLSASVKAAWAERKKRQAHNDSS